MNDHDGTCDICKGETNSWAGNPGLWPIWIGPGCCEKVYHTKCIMDAIRTYKEGEIGDKDKRGGVEL